MVALHQSIAAADIPRFEDVPADAKACVLGVSYVPLFLPDGGELYLTEHGWPWRDHLMPQLWYDQQRYVHEGKKLRFSTGHVYRYNSRAKNRALDIVVKISRMAQDVPIVVLHDHGVVERDPLAAEFLTPFDELATLQRFRQKPVSPQAPRIYTKRALAIYTPPLSYKEWELGRTPSLLNSLIHRIQHSQAAQKVGQRIQLYPSRDYFVIYAWIKGENAEELHDAGLLTRQDLHELARTVAQDMAAQGFTVLDHKPNHIILRRRKRDGRILTRRGKFVYAMADFELLVPLSPFHKGG